MVRVTCILVVLAAGIASVPICALAQTPSVAPQPPLAGLAGSSEPNPLPNLPRPPEQPDSLFQPAPAAPVYGCPELERPYFERDPLLDPVCLPQPGWLFDVELGVLGSTVTSEVGQTATPIPGVVAVPMATLDWTVSPRFELGYRLPAGFGEVDVAYRFLFAQGTGSTPAGSAASPDAAAVLTSHLNMNVVDLDYAANETSLGPCWGMRWRIGLRYADVLFDSRADESLAAAAAGSGIFERSIQNNYWGIGPHAAVELSTQRNPSGLRWVGRLDGGLLFGEVQQSFTQISTAGAVTVTAFDNAEQAAMLGGFLGLDWRPPCRPNLDLLLGYSGEYWWNVARISNPDIYNGQSAGEVGLQGAQLRLEYNY